MRKTSLVRIRLIPNKGDRAQVIPFGDVHLGYPTTDVEMVREVLDGCLRKRIYIVGMGDLIECGLTTSVGDSVYQQKLNPQEQMDEMVEMLTPMAKDGLILGLICGNHESRIAKSTSIDVTAMMCRLLKVPYLGFSCFHYWKVGEESYTAYSCHGASGARLPYTKIKSALDLFRFVDAECVLMGHVHSLDHMTQMYYRVDRRTKMMVEARRHAVLTGHFMDYEGSYAEMKLLPPSPPGIAKISLYGKKHEIFVSL
jgi:hypothetical protein